MPSIELLKPRQHNKLKSKLNILVKATDLRIKNEVTGAKLCNILKIKLG